MSSIESNVSILLLAAGGSSRLGQPKQLLPYKGTSLLRHLVLVALACEAKNVTVVLGAHAEKVRNELSGLDVRIVENPRWKDGIGSSIRIGIDTLPPSSAAVLLMLCDQPHITTNLLDSMIKLAQTSGKPIVACEYAGTVGIPVLFSRKFFDELTTLRMDTGAKGILRNHSQDVARVPFPRAAFDIDTPDDLSRFNGS